MLIGIECTLGVIAQETLQLMRSGSTWRDKETEACRRLAERGGEFRVRAASARHHSSSLSTMPVVLPGEIVQTQHKTLKLGPGLQQFTNPEGKISNIVTRAGTLEQNAKGTQFWVEGNSRRVSFESFGRSSFSHSVILLCLDKVCAGTTGACHRHRECPTG